jgi:hypothetical protein
MTQKVRWLAALALLLAFGARAARAEEEEDQAPPPKPTVVELLPAPHVVPVDMPFGPVTSPTGWLFLFPSANPCPAPSLPAAFGGCGQSCPACPACSCRQVTPEDAPQYVVAMKMVKAAASADGEEEVVACPRLTVCEGQKATVQLHGVETAKERSSLQVELTVTKQGEAASMDLAVTDSGAVQAHDIVRIHTETTDEKFHVVLGESKKMELHHDKDGTPVTWVEVTVTEVEREEVIQKTASVQGYPDAKMADRDDACDFRDCIVDVVEDVLDTIADAASGLFATETSDEATTLPVDPNLEHPVQYLESPTPLPLPRELAAREATCPNSKSTCVQCTSLEMVKKPTMHIRIEAQNGRQCVEVTDGGKCWKATAERLMVNDGRILLEGDVHAESCGDSLTIHAEKVLLEHKEDGLKIHVGD